MKITVRGKAFFAAGISLVFFINVKGGETGAAAVAYSFD
jgi:hypothetical protein